MEGYQFVLEPITIAPTEPVEVVHDGNLLNDAISHTFLDSMLYVMLPSLVTFCTVLVGFYLLHEFTTQAQLMGLRQSIIQKAGALRATVCNVSPGEQAETVELDPQVARSGEDAPKMPQSVDRNGDSGRIEGT